MRDKNRELCCICGAYATNQDDESFEYFDFCDDCIKLDKAQQMLKDAVELERGMIQEQDNQYMQYQGQ